MKFKQINILEERSIRLLLTDTDTGVHIISQEEIDSSLLRIREEMERFNNFVKHIPREF